MDFNQALSKKLKKGKWNQKEINFLIKEIINGRTPDYKIATLLASIYINGMSDDELFHLTTSMCDSGEKIDFSKSNYIVDKHSTGGVGDKVTIILSPILAAFGIKVAKMSGRGLGITGGTIDKLNSVKINTTLNLNQARKLINDYNMFIMEQTTGMVPADGIFYKLRDVTSTIDSIPLIVSSIMSKKLAIQSNHIYLDVKVGKGAFFNSKISAEEFVTKAMMIAKKRKRKLTCTLTKMDKPLGSTVGNRLEIYESLNFLDGIFESKRLKDLIYFFVGEVLVDKKIASSIKESSKLIDEMIYSKKPLNIFLKYAKELGMDSFNNFGDLIKAKNIIKIRANNTGYLEYPNAYTTGLLALEMKAGRKIKSDKIDTYAGIRFLVDENSWIEKNDIIAEIHSSFEIKKEWVEDFLNSLEFSKRRKIFKSSVIGVYNA